MDKIGMINAPARVMQAMQERPKERPESKLAIWPFRHLREGEGATFAAIAGATAWKRAKMYGTKYGKTFKLVALPDGDVQIVLVGTGKVGKHISAGTSNLITFGDPRYGAIAMSPALEEVLNSTRLGTERRWPFKYMEVGDWIVYDRLASEYAKNMAKTYSRNSHKQFDIQTKEHSMKVKRVA